MTISFSRLQDYLDAIVLNEGGNLAAAPHKRFWSSYQALIAQPLPHPQCQGQSIFPVKFSDAAKTRVDADNSPLFLILTSAGGFCQKPQMPPGGPYLTDAAYSLLLSDGTAVSGAQVIRDIHDWLSANAPNDPP